MSGQLGMFQNIVANLSFFMGKWPRLATKLLQELFVGCLHGVLLSLLIDSFFRHQCWLAVKSGELLGNSDEYWILVNPKIWWLWFMALNISQLWKLLTMRLKFGILGPHDSGEISQWNCSPAWRDTVTQLLPVAPLRSFVNGKNFCQNLKQELWISYEICGEILHFFRSNPLVLNEWSQ